MCKLMEVTAPCVAVHSTCDITVPKLLDFCSYLSKSRYISSLVPRPLHSFCRLQYEKPGTVLAPSILPDCGV